MGISLISNPPYNMKHELPPLANFMSRYTGWTLPPESNANYAFILSSLSWIEDKAIFLLPNGVLTSGGKEKEIRAQLINENLIRAVIMLPDRMFESTSIPTCIIVIDKNKTTRKVAMIDISGKCEEEVRDQNGQYGGNSHTKRTYHKTVNVIPNELMQTCAELIANEQDSPDLCVWVSPDQIKEKDYALTPRMYFEIHVEEHHRSFEDIAADYNRIIKQKNAIKIKMNRTAAKRLGYDCMDKGKIDLSESFEIVGQKVKREDNITFSADDGITIKISTKDGIHPLVLDFLSHWKQMIMYLNNEENRYLAEFRDALLPELMSGKIEV